MVCCRSSRSTKIYFEYENFDSRSSKTNKRNELTYWFNELSVFVVMGIMISQECCEPCKPYSIRPLWYGGYCILGMGRCIGYGEYWGAYHWCHAFGKQKRKWEIGFIIGNVWFKRTISWSHVCPQTRVEVQTDLSQFASIHSVRWLVGVRLTVERWWRSVMFYEKIPYLSKNHCNGVIIYSYILK